MVNEPKIIIIGAGAAGIAAAARLIEKGFGNVTILEGKNRIGGRIHTVEFSDNVVELGAQWVHGERGNVVFDLASPHKLLDSSRCFNDFNGHIFVTARGEILPKKEAVETLKLYYYISEHVTDDINNSNSYGEYFINRFYRIFEENPFTTPDRAEQLLDWMHKFDNSFQCSDSWFEVSAKEITNYWTCEGDLVLNWKHRGYKTLFDLLSRKACGKMNLLPIIEKIEFNKDVSNIDYRSRNNIVVKTKDGVKYTASHVIFTPSLGVLKEKHATMFAPILPDKKQRAIKGLNIGTVNKVFLEFSHRWWQEDCAGFSLIWSKEDKTEFLKSHGQEYEWLCDVFAFVPVDYQPRVLCAWISGKYAKQMESLSDSSVSDGLFLLLKMFLDKAYNIPKFHRTIRSSWYTDEHFRGSYSFKSLTTEKLSAKTEDLADPLITADGKPVILFAGEATHDHYYSTVHGAVETGFREANRIINFHRTCGWLNQAISSLKKLGRMVGSANQITARTKVVIVGAGIAGLSAAKTLEDANFCDYLLFEAQNVIGGRIRSLAWNKSWIESGAQFLHGDQSLLAQLCYRNGLLSDVSFRDGQGIFIRNNGIRVDETIVEEIDDLVRNTLEDYENRDVEPGSENIGRVLTNSLKKHLQQRDESATITDIKKELFDWNVRFLMIDNSCLTLDELSTKYWGKFKFVGGPEYLSFKAGYNSLSKLIADGLNGKNLRLNTSVDLIEWQQIVVKDRSTPVLLTLSDNTKILTDCVIITSSLGYLKENYKNMFTPVLPSPFDQAIESLGFGLINKIFLDFGTPWWKPGTKGFQLLWKESGVSDIYCNETLLPTWTRDLTGFDVLPDHEGVLLGWVGGRGAYIVETLSEQQVAIDCATLLKHYLKLDAMPLAKSCLRTQWNANNYVRGSYSHISTKCDENGVSPATLAEPIWSKIIGNYSSKDIPVIMFAGEATHDNFYSTTHGAYETGVKQAQVFLRHHLLKN